MKKNITTLLLIFGIASCVQLPMAPIYEYSYTLNRCLTACYDYNKGKAVRDSRCGDNYRSGSYHVSVCDSITGPKIDYFARELKPAYEFNKNEFERLKRECE